MNWLKKLFCKHKYVNIFMKNAITINDGYVFSIDVCEKCNKIKFKAERR